MHKTATGTVVAGTGLLVHTVKKGAEMEGEGEGGTSRKVLQSWVLYFG